MRSVILRSLAVIAVGGLVLAAVLYVASTVDARPPRVLEVRLTHPVADDPTSALITSSLEVAFSEPVEPGSAEAAVSLEPAVEGSVSWSGSTMIFTPRAPLELETRYTLRIGDGIRDVAGNDMSEAPPPFVFETAGRPELAVASPPHGAEEVPLEATIALSFSTLMDTASVESALRLRPSFPHELRWSGELLEIVPTGARRPGVTYEVAVQGTAADVAGVALAEPILLRFRSVAPGLVADALVPADGTDGIAPRSPIAIIFDRPIDPDSVSDDLLAISPAVAGTLDLLPLPDDPASGDGAGRLLRFRPSAPLASNTTFEVELAPGLAGTDGGALAGPISWSFTTGAPVTIISNQITFITERAGVSNVWLMNPDGTGQRQLSVELAPVLDYAVAPDGSSLVVGDGRRLVFQRPDGSERRVLTDEGAIEFDPAYAPDARRVAFARADAETGEGLGLWEWQVGAGDATPIILPPEESDRPNPPDDDLLATLRAPRYAPDGDSLAFVDPAGWVGLLALPERRLTRAGFDAGSAPVWMPDSASVLLTGRPSDAAEPPPRLQPPVAPLTPELGDRLFRLPRSGTAVADTSLGAGSRLVAVAPGGEIAYVGSDGWLRLSRSPAEPGDRVTSEIRVASGAFAPAERTLVVVVAARGETGSIELLDLETGARTALVPRGARPRWLP